MATIYYYRDDFARMHERFRATFLNSLNGVKTTSLIGTKGHDGTENLSIFNSITHLGADPALIGLLVRPQQNVRRDTLRNIDETRVCTINMVSTDWYENAHQTSAKYPAEVSEFAACGFTPSYVNDFQAPIVTEAHVSIGWRLQEQFKVTSNQTTFLVGSVEFVRVENNLLGEDGFFDHAQAKTLLSSGLNNYLSALNLASLQYARVAN